ncbi:apelin receptor [Procambarus clarkii]|uniref:apelin receptor n=1 Tax=Procambarus clarkii TaxID=6728 RepID=UPI001E671432|nr:platelet-activating factor receptor-like [Procambarus clarkii]
MADFEEFEVSENIGNSEYEAFQKLGIIISVVISSSAVVGVVANAYVVWLLRSRAVFSVSSVYLLNRCLADLLFLLPAPVFATQYSLMNWVFGNAICKLTMAQLYVCSYASYSFMIALSVDFMRVVTQHVDDDRSVLMKILVTVIWATAIALALPFFILFETLQFGHSTVTHCFLNFPYFWLPIFDIISVASITATMVTSWVMVFIAATPSSAHEVPQENGTKARTAWRLLVALTITFTTLHLPYAIIQTLHFCQIVHGPTMLKPQVIINSLVFVNAAVNPLVYLAVMRHSGQDSHQHTDSIPITLQGTEEDRDF